MPSCGTSPREGTWGIILGIDTPMRVNISNGDTLRVCGACFGENPGTNRVIVRARVIGGCEIVMCALTPGIIENAMLMLEFREGTVELHLHIEFGVNVEESCR